MEDHRVDCPDGTNDSNLEEGAGDLGFDPNDYEGMEDPSSQPSATTSLLPPHVKAAHVAYHYEEQEQQCYTCDETGHFSHKCPVCLQALKDMKCLNSKGGPNAGEQKPLKQPERDAEGAPPETEMHSSMHVSQEPVAHIE